MLTPRENVRFVGHQVVREAFLRSFHSKRFPHAWIFGGPVGIGKATFAFHMARYILSGRKDGNTIFPENDPLYRQVRAQSHGDLWTICGELENEIGIESIRDLNGFLTRTSGEGGFRVIIIDGAEKLNRNAANALLKRLEEPPVKTVFFLITPLPGRLLPTLRSRCQRLMFQPLKEEEVEEVLCSQEVEPFDITNAQGSPGYFMRLMEGEGAQVYEDFQKIVEANSIAASFIHTYGDNEKAYTLVENMIRTFFHAQLLAKLEGKSGIFQKTPLEQVLEGYEKVENLLSQCRFAQLDRKATLTCVFASLERLRS